MPLFENPTSRYGGNVRNIPFMNPGAKYFFVGPSAATWYGDFISSYGPDQGGGNRVFSTLTACIADGNLSASRGDVIFLLPGFTQTISSSTALSLSIAGITIVGVGAGSLRPTITLDTATSSTINVTANNISISNCIFVANFASIVAPFTLTTAKDFVIDKCEFRDTSAILNFTNIISTGTTSNAADGITLTNSKRIGSGADSNTTIINMLGTNDRLTVTDNYFAHLAVTGGGGMIIATGKIATNVIWRRNVHNFLGATGLATGMIITTNGSTNSGILADNLDQNLDQTTEILVTASSGFIFFNNWHSGVADKSGYLVPAADA